MNLNIIMLPVDSLTPYSNNARKHKDFDVDAIAASIEAFGFNDPIAVWGSDNTIVEGHGRLLAAQKLGLQEVPCIRLDDLSEEDRRAYALAHNKTAELSLWDEEKLREEIDDLDFDMSDFGFGAELKEDIERFTTTEYSIDDFSDEGFKYECKKCGFKFNA